jgi:hypothetical protein
MNLQFDIKRSVILAEYIKCWGRPESRNVISINNPQVTEETVELYIFPGEDMDQVSRVATIGLSSCIFPNGKSCNSELLMVLPYDIVDDESESISNYILSICKYIINIQGRNLKSAEICEGINENRPKDWPDALLFDEPRGEPNELNNFYIGIQHVKLSWLVPIFSSEYELIRNNGIESFDAAVNEGGTSLVEVRRDACI